MLTTREAFNKTKRCQQIAVGDIYKVFFFFFEIKIEILFDKREIHVQTHYNPLSTNTGEQRPVLQKTKYAAKEIQPMDIYNTETATEITITPCKQRLFITLKSSWFCTKPAMNHKYDGSQCNKLRPSRPRI